MFWIAVEHSGTSSFFDKIFKVSASKSPLDCKHLRHGQSQAGHCQDLREEKKYIFLERVKLNKDWGKRWEKANGLTNTLNHGTKSLRPLRTGSKKTAQKIFFRLVIEHENFHIERKYQTVKKATLSICQVEDNFSQLLNCNQMHQPITMVKRWNPPYFVEGGVHKTKTRPSFHEDESIFSPLWSVLSFCVN